MLIKNQITLLPKQTTAWDLLENVDSPIDEEGYGGGAGGGKTKFGCYLAISLSDLFPESRGAIGRFELKNLKRTTLASFFEVAGELGLKQKERRVKDWDYDYNQQDGIIKFRNKSEIYLIDTAPSPKDTEYTRFGSLELSWCWIDESNESPYKAIEILGTRVGRRNKNPRWTETLKIYFGRHDEKDGWVLKPIFLETFNPEKGHIYQRYWKPFKEAKMPSYRTFVRALASDNPFLPTAYIRSIMRKSKATIERLIYGNFDYDDDPTKIFNYDRLNDLFTNTHAKTGQKFLTGDIAGKGKDKTVLYIWDGLRVIYIYHEDYTDQKQLRKRILELKEKYQIPMSNILLDYDGIGVGIVDELECKGFQNNASAIASSQEKTAGLKANFANLRSQCWILLSEYVNDAKIYIQCDDETVSTYIIEELDVIKELTNSNEEKRRVIPKGSNGKDGEEKETIKALLGRSPDFGDGLMMRMYFELNHNTANVRLM